MSDAKDEVDGRWVEDMFEDSARWPRRSCGAAGGAHSQFNRVAGQPNEWSAETLGFETRGERDLTLVLHRPVEPTPSKQTFGCAFAMSVKCHKQTSTAVSAKAPRRGAAVDAPSLAASLEGFSRSRIGRWCHGEDLKEDAPRYEPVVVDEKAEDETDPEHEDSEQK